MNYLLVFMGGLQVSDGVMTDILVKANAVNEGNMLVRPLLENGNYVIIKIIGALLCIAALKLISKRFRRAALFTGVAAAAFYLAVLGWNVGTLLS